MDTLQITADQVTLQIPESLTLICPDARLKERIPEFFLELQEYFRRGSSVKCAFILLDDKFQGGEFGTNIGIALRAHFFTEGSHFEGVDVSVSSTLDIPRGVHGQDYVLVAAGFHVQSGSHPYTHFDSSSCRSRYAYGYDSPKDENFPLDATQLYNALKKNYPDSRSSELIDLLEELVHMEVKKAFEL